MSLYAFTSQHSFDRGDPLWVSLNKPSSLVTFAASKALSPDIDSLPAVLDVIHQTSGADSVLAHAVRVARMSAQSLARIAYPSYLEFRESMRRTTGSFTDTGVQQLWVPIYCSYEAERHGGGGPTRWSVSRWKGGPFIIGNAARLKRDEAVREASRFLRAYGEGGHTLMRGLLLMRPDAPEICWFARPPLASDPAAVALESVWRTVKSRHPNEVALAELAV